ncbi:MAG: SRPBCC family protein [Candidatus Nanopelagicales bacterium]|nr:SRPBCC family protein [Candidatus Nanopelagicales bacterium]
MELSLSVEVKASQQKVFDKIVDWESQGQWMLGTKVSGTKNNGQGLGGEINAWTGFWKIGFNDPMVITQWIEPKIVDVKHIGRLVKGTGSMVVEKIDENNSRFIWSESIYLPFGFIGKIGWTIIKPFFVSGIKFSLNKFALTFAQIDPK